LNVTYHIFKDFQLDTTGSSDEEIFERSGEEIRKNRYSFVSMCRPPGSEVIYTGATHGLGDLLVEFDTEKREFASCGYAESGLWIETEHKIHKGIWFDKAENALYFGTSTLSHIKDTVTSPGGILARYDCEKNEFSELARPTPGDFFQATGYDPERKKMYMYTMPGACFAVYDLNNKELIRYDPMQSIPHIGAIDDNGGVWGTYSANAQAFFRYNPDTDTYEFPEGCAFPDAYSAANVMYRGAGPVDSMENGQDGYIYTASALGEVYRIDPGSKEVTYLGKPFTGKRLPAMDLADDGMIYLAGGSDKAPMLARYDRETRQFEFLGPVTADDGLSCYRCHELRVVDNVAYIGETDNPSRSGYMWACEF